MFIPSHKPGFIFIRKHLQFLLPHSSGQYHPKDQSPYLHLFSLINQCFNSHRYFVYIIVHNSLFYIIIQPWALKQSLHYRLLCPFALYPCPFRECSWACRTKGVRLTTCSTYLSKMCKICTEEYGWVYSISAWTL